MADRLLLTLLITIVLIIAYRTLRGYSLQKRTGLGLELDDYHIGRPAILYFTTPSCVPCRSIQRPALNEVEELFGDDIQIIEVNALSQPRLADKWGVLSVPTTFIIDGQGRPRRVNNGVAKAEKLIHQLVEFLDDVSIITNDVAQIGETLQSKPLRTGRDPS